MATKTQTLEAVSVTLTGAAVGAMVGGPIGLGVGLVLGGVVDWLILKAKAAPAGFVLPPAGVVQSFAAPTSTLPPGADVDSANRAILLMRLGKPAEVTPARGWLQKFQTSVGLPATGQLDATTRSMLMQVSPSTAAAIPSPSILG